jgi:3-hydroxyacyl-CoA dehydrogenase
MKVVGAGVMGQAWSAENSQVSLQTCKFDIDQVSVGVFIEVLMGVFLRC